MIPRGFLPAMIMLTAGIKLSCEDAGERGGPGGTIRNCPQPKKNGNKFFYERSRLSPTRISNL